MEARVYGQLYNDGYTTRQQNTSIRWGFSQQSLGAIVLMKPIATKFRDPLLSREFNKSVKKYAFDELEITPEFKQLIGLVEFLKKDELEDKELSGVFDIYSLYSNYLTSNEYPGIDYIEDLCDPNMLFQFENNIYPFVIIAWGFNKPLIRIKNIKDFHETKRKWLNVLEGFNYICGVQGKSTLSFLSLFQRKSEDLVKYNNTIRGQIKEKDAINCKENIVIFSSSLAKKYSRSSLFSFKHLNINPEYELAGYPNIWAYPKGSQIPNESETFSHFDFKDIDLPTSEKPDNAKDPMVAIVGDRTQESYLEAAIFYHKINDLTRERHYGTWRYLNLLPFQEGEVINKDLEWNMFVHEPEIWEPHFKISKSGKPLVIFYTFSEIMPYSINQHIHVFSDTDYTLKVKTRTVANAKGGIIP